jgi:hypothetical protein
LVILKESYNFRKEEYHDGEILYYWFGRKVLKQALNKVYPKWSSWKFKSTINARNGVPQVWSHWFDVISKKSVKGEEHKSDWNRGFKKTHTIIDDTEP